MGKTAKEIIDFTEGFSRGATLTVVNEAIQSAKTTEERLELLVLKCSLLEDSIYGQEFTIT
ncbi:hypothetical protein [Salipaludibacillus sp. CF4.18]|uniref:hypothetical protein n=1 Tax=Salipaludibacillus sp. CF4.18 TaxID=3373081 RepID=UPI003EE46409